MSKFYYIEPKSKSLIEEIFNEINIRKLNYFLIRDFLYETSGDIDIFVEISQKNTFEKILFNKGWLKRVEVSEIETDIYYYHEDCVNYFHVKYLLEFTDGKNVYSYKLINKYEKIITSNKFGIKKLSGIDSVIIYFGKINFFENRINQKKLFFFLNLIQSNLDEIKKNNFYNEFIKINELLKKNSKNLVLHKNYSEIIKSKHFVKSRVLNKKKMNYGHGMNVLFLGTDGSGKTSLIKILEDNLNLKTKKLYLGMGEDNCHFNIIKKFKNINPKNYLLKKIKSLIFTILLFPIELLLRIIVSKINSKYKIILIDRFPGYPLLSSNIFIKNIYKLILPKPDIVIFLKGDETVISKRKTKLNELQTKKNTIKFEKLAELLLPSNYISIDTTNLSIEQTMFTVKKNIFCHKKIKNLLHK